VPSPLHDAFVQFFNTHTHCVLRLAAVLGLDLRAPISHWRRVSGAFGDPSMTGKEYKADIILAALPHDTSDDLPPGTRALAVLILEPQLRLDPEKGISWLVYRGGIAGRYGTCPQWVLMVTPVPGLPLAYRDAVYPDQPELWPIFVTAGSVTPVLEQDVANADPPWAALCVALHARGPLFVPAAKVALQACTGLPADQRRVILAMIAAGLRKKDMQEIQKEMPEETREKWELTEYEREGAWYQGGLEQGLEQGLRISLLRVLEARGLSPTPEQRAEIDGCSDIDQLQRWLDRSVQAASVAEVLARCA
jgi:hypothetical protein